MNYPVDSAIHRLDHYPVDNTIIGFCTTYPLDSELSGGALSNLWTTKPRPGQFYFCWNNTYSLFVLFICICSLFRVQFSQFLSHTNDVHLFFNFDHSFSSDTVAIDTYITAVYLCFETLNLSIISIDRVFHVSSKTKMVRNFGSYKAE